MYQLHCPLGHTLEIGPEHFGQRLMCPMCQAVVHASPPRMGEVPKAKYEVQCAQGHILRVKDKYLGKEIRCPTCQQLVSMKAAMLLTSDGKPLGTAMPEAFKKKTKAVADPVSNPPSKRQQKAPPPQPKSGGKANVPTERIPPPPQAGPANDTDDNPPMPPEVVEEDDNNVAMPSQVKSVSPNTVHDDDDFEFEVVDTQFNMEIKSLGLETKSGGSGRVGHKAPPPPPPPRQKPQVKEAPFAPEPDGPVVPTGLHNLSGSEMMKVQYAVTSPEPDGSALLQFHCPSGHLLEVEAQHRGAQIQCPMCQVIFVLPNA